MFWLPVKLGVPLHSNNNLKISVGANTKVYLFYGSCTDILNRGWNGYLECCLESGIIENITRFITDSAKSKCLIVTNQQIIVSNATTNHIWLNVYPSALQPNMHPLTSLSTCVRNIPRSLGAVKAFNEERFFYKTYGIMFDIVAKSYQVTITTIGFYTDAYAGNEVSYKIYTKVGSYVGFERMLSAWNLHASRTVPSAGSSMETQVV